MKKFLLIFLLFALFIFFASCSTEDAPDETTNDVELEYEDPILVDEMINAVYDGDYSKAEELAAEINELYPESPDAKMADIYLGLADKMKNHNSEKYTGIDFKSVIQLISVRTDSPNSAGGVNLHIKWKNTSDKTIKYAYFTCDLYNAVDDRVPDTITNGYSFTGKVTGPINPGVIYGDSVLWENAWWNNSGRYAKITKIKIEYMDGTKVEIPQSQIDTLFY